MVDGPEPEVVDGGTLSQVVEAADRPVSVMETLRRGYEAATAQQPVKDLRLPGYGEPDSQLYVTFHILDDYEEARASIKRAMKQPGLSAGRRELLIGVGLLAQAAEGSYAIVGGERHEIGKPLGLALYDELFPDDGKGRPGKDVEAISLLYHSNEVLMMSAANTVDRWIQNGGMDAEDGLLGE